MADLRDMHAFIVRWMREHADERMPYHDLDHTLDVAEASMRIGDSEALGDEEMDLLAAAALFHDVGHQVSGSKEHEAASCDFARKHMPQFGFNVAQVERVCRLIMTTKIPQAPFDAASRALCDADLDYLGRSDFHEIGNKLFAEMKMRGEIRTEREWNEVQDRFLGKHHYHTDYALREREPGKQRHHAEVRRWLRENP